MSDIQKNDGNDLMALDLMALIHGKNGSLTIPKPFEQNIFLFDTHVAGTTFIEGIEELASHLSIDDRLDFFREPDNPYDDRAIVIKNFDGVKVGYVPKEDNVVFSRLMDAGKLLFGKISFKEIKGDWLKLDIKIYLHE